MSLSIRLIPEPVRSLAFGSIGVAYMGIGTAITKPVRIFHLQNLTDANLMFSFGGVDDHVAIPAGGYLLIDVTANKSNERGFFIGEGERIYVKRIGTPTTGSVYLSTFYGAD